MPKTSAGILMYRRRKEDAEVLLVHPGGPFYSRRDAGVWSIPKGEYEPGEDALAAAVREFEEETGSRPGGPFQELEPVQQKGGKVVRAWASEGDCDPAVLRSNLFTLEWPPRSGQLREFPEVDRGAWFPLAEARRRILAGQLPLVEELERLLR